MVSGTMLFSGATLMRIMSSPPILSCSIVSFSVPSAPFGIDLDAHLAAGLLAQQLAHVPDRLDGRVVGRDGCRRSGTRARSPAAPCATQAPSSSDRNAKPIIVNLPLGVSGCSIETFAGTLIHTQMTKPVQRFSELLWSASDISIAVQPVNGYVGVRGNLRRRREWGECGTGTERPSGGGCRRVLCPRSPIARSRR